MWLQVVIIMAWSPWAARYNTWLLIKLTPKGVVFSFLFYACEIWDLQAEQAAQKAEFMLVKFAQLAQSLKACLVSLCCCHGVMPWATS